jgi:hypothetical protein
MFKHIRSSCKLSVTMTIEISLRLWTLFLNDLLTLGPFIDLNDSGIFMNVLSKIL